MQVFNVFMKITKKKLPTAGIYIGIFLVMAFIVSSSMSDEKSFMETKLKIGVIDHDESSASKALTEYIGSKHKLVDVKDDKNEMLNSLYYENANYILLIENGYEEKLKRSETEDLFKNYQVHKWYGGSLFELDLNEYVSTIVSYLAGGNDFDAAIKKTSDAMQGEMKVDMVSFDKEAAASKDFSTGEASFFRYLPYIFLNLMITLLCPVLTTIHSKEVNNRTNCSSTSITKFNLQIFLASGVLILVIWLMFMAAAGSINGFFLGRAWIAVLNSLVFIMVAAGIAILLSLFAPSSTIMNVVANVVSLGMSFLCGIFVPQNMLGVNVMRFSKFLPAYWYAKVNDLLSGAEESYSAVKCLQYIGIEAAFVIALFAVTLLIRKTKQEAKI